MFAKGLTIRLVADDKAIVRIENQKAVTQTFDRVDKACLEPLGFTLGTIDFLFGVFGVGDIANDTIQFALFARRDMPVEE